jgi:hypothetical protein
MAYVYLLCDSGHDNMFKIGITRGNIEKRVKKLQTGNANEIFLVNYYETEYPFFIEKMMHLRHFGNHKHGEWFELESYDLSNFIKHCKECEEIAEAMKNNPFGQKLLK